MKGYEKKIHKCVKISTCQVYGYPTVESDILGLNITGNQIKNMRGQYKTKRMNEKLIDCPKPYKLFCLYSITLLQKLFW